MYPPGGYICAPTTSDRRCLESGSNHPLAQAITAAAQLQDLPLLEARDFTTAIGQGISAMVAAESEYEPAYLGNQSWLSNNGIEVNQTAETEAESLAKSGKTVVYLAYQGRLQGLIALEDSLRGDAKATIAHLQSLNLNTVLLTGDRPEVAQAIAQKLNLTQVFAEVKPEGKAEVIKSLQQEQTVAMIGDGINDAPALAQADVGISLQQGTDVAIATADIVLMRNQLQDLIKAIELSRATVNKIKQNLVWALAYNAFSLPIAAGILLPKYGLLLSPVWAAAAMASSSLIVVTNSLLLNNFKSGD